MHSTRASSRPGSPFQKLLLDARAGDNEAREALYNQFGPQLRRVIARRLMSRRIEWATTPHDVFDDVMLRVWNEDAMYAFCNEEDFFKYVSRAVEREVSNLRRNLTAPRRDYRRMEPLFADETRFASAANDPAQGVSQQEEIDFLRSQLSEENQLILELRLAGREWDAIGTQCGLAADAARKRLQRSIMQLLRRMAD